MKNKIDKQALREKIQSLEGLSNDDKSQLLALLAEQKKYGLVWEDRPEEAEEVLRENIPVLHEVTEKRLDKGGDDAPNHILIEGDNLHALTALTYTHEGKVDVIYIDPPYNTGNKDFVYNDSFVDSEDSYRHSKWLSFMERRLRIAKKLLSDKGVIFISIDDNEQANLKLLCDEVFGEINYISSIPWHSRQSMQNDTDFSINHEYVICYAKNRRQTNRRLKPSNADIWYDQDGFVFYPCKLDNGKFSNPDNDTRGPWKADPFDAPNIRPNLSYAITNPNTGEIFYPPTGRHWRMAEEKYTNAFQDNRIVFGKNGKSKPQLKVFLNELEDFGAVPNSWFEAEVYKTATHGSKELQQVFCGEKAFTSPKPIELIIEILKMVTIPNRSYTILDFFAGSGTTLHATMQLNAEDGGHRQCILVTNNENNICEEVTYERNKRVINGYTTPKGASVEGLKKNNLRYYKTEFVPRDNSLTGKRKLMSSCTDLLCIKNDLYKEETSFGRLNLKATIARYFNDGKKQMLIIYNVDAIEDIVEEIKQMPEDTKLQVYVFSTTNYAMDTDFDEVSDKVSLCALPAAIYNAYLKVLPKKKELETNEDNEEVEA